MEWTEEVIAQLRALWAEGLSTAEIGRRLHVSKNAVVGKAHRLNLPPRPSPIRRSTVDAAPRPRATLSSEPTLPSLEAPAPAPASVPPAPRPPAPRPPAESPRPVLRSVPNAPGAGRVTACCWPIGEPGTKGFHFCDDPSAPGKPYCSAHAAVAYVKVRDRREEAA